MPLIGFWLLSMSTTSDYTFSHCGAYSSCSFPLRLDFKWVLICIDRRKTLIHTHVDTRTHLVWLSFSQSSLGLRFLALVPRPHIQVEKLASIAHSVEFIVPYFFYLSFGIKSYFEFRPSISYIASGISSGVEDIIRWNGLTITLTRQDFNPLKITTK